MHASDVIETHRRDATAARAARHRKRPRWRRLIAGGLLAIIAVVTVAGAILVNVQHLKLEPVLSGSMRPGIQPGDLAVVRPIPVSELQVGDVIAYLPPRQTVPVLHRIVSINSQGIVTKGDANPVADPWGRVKPRSTSVERLVTVIPKIGMLTDVKRQVLMVLGVIVLLAAAVALWPAKADPAPDGNPDPLQLAEEGNDSTDDESDLGGSAHSGQPQSNTNRHRKAST